MERGKIWPKIRISLIALNFSKRGEQQHSMEKQTASLLSFCRSIVTAIPIRTTTEEKARALRDLASGLGARWQVKCLLILGFQPQSSQED